MHLLNFKAYEDDKNLKRPAFWKIDPKRRIVGSKAKDTAPTGSLWPNSATVAGQKGQNVQVNYGPPPHQAIGWLPQGAEITLGKITGDWAELVRVVVGTPLVRSKISNLFVNNKISIKALDTFPPAPEVMDAVHILSDPVKIKARELIGHLGEYQRFTEEVSTFNTHRPIMHLEVFAGPEFKDFVEQCRAIDARAPTRAKRLLVIERGAELREGPFLGWKKLSRGELLKPADDSPKRGIWIKLERGTVQVVDSAKLKGYNEKKQKYGNGVFMYVAVRPDGSDPVQANDYSSKKHPQHTWRKTFTPDGTTVWVDRSWYQRHTVQNKNGLIELTADYEFAREKFRLDTQVKDNNDTKQLVGATITLDINEIGDNRLAMDDQGVRWWQVRVAGHELTRDGYQSVGSTWLEEWACEKDHEKVRLCTPWAWPGFDLFEDTDTPLTQWYELQQKGKYPADSPILKSLYNHLDANKDGKLTLAEIHDGWKKPYLVQPLSRQLIKHKNEWGLPMSEWETLDKHMQGTSSDGVDFGKMWQEEKKRIEKLRWWDEVAGQHGFPGGIEVWHIHPLALVENFDSLKQYIDIDLFVENYKKRHGDFSDSKGRTLDAKSEGYLRIMIEQFVKYYEAHDDIEWFIPQVAYILATARHECLWREVFFESRTEGGPVSYFNRYDPVLATGPDQRAWAIKMENTQQGDGYKYRGRGYPQLTWKKNYRRCGELIGVDLVNNPERAAEPAISAACIIRAMLNGTFTELKLDKFVNKKGEKDYLNARKVVNGVDKAPILQGHAVIFEEILEESK
jgi:hypothetical protein